MVTIAEVERLVTALPDVEVGVRYANRTWLVGGKGFAWERAFSKADVRRYGDEPVPTGPILAVRTADLPTKEAVLAAGTRGVFTIPHFDGYAAVLIQLDRATIATVRRLLTDAWTAVASTNVLARHRTSTRRRAAPGGDGKLSRGRRQRAR